MSAELIDFASARARLASRIADRIGPETEADRWRQRLQELLAWPAAFRRPISTTAAPLARP